MSLIICNFNGEAVIGECMDSARAQSHRAVEIIVVDDGSTDGSCDVVRGYTGVKLVRSPSNRGIAHARNLGLRVAQGTFIAFLDNDVVLEHDWAERMLEAALHNPRARLFASHILTYDDPGRMDNTGGYVNLAGYAWNRDAGCLEPEATGTAHVFFPCGAAMFMSRGLLEEVGEFDDCYRYAYDDVELGWQAHALGYEVIYVPEARVRHRISFTMGSHNPRKLYFCERGRIRAFLKNLEAPLLREVAPEAAAILMQHIRQELTDKGRGQSDNRKYAAALSLAALWNLAHLPATLWRRRRFQMRRRVSDRELLSRGLLVGRVERPMGTGVPQTTRPPISAGPLSGDSRSEILPGLVSDGSQSALGEGWHLPEMLSGCDDGISYRWTGSQAEVTLNCNGKGERLVIETLLSHPSGSGRIEVLVNDQRVGILVVPNRPGRHALPLNAASFNGGLTVRLKALDPFRPRDTLRGSYDERVLGVAVTRIALE